ncbi:hypothetical protein [Streptomyces coffeae]|uniref:Uncharacterized protein n=1 Tax=Streptomyces coffeae TaxID=621382 RepID=A0ABS1N6W7_9ACTN|nr:hypothetical protein [Streptomyces coffeae]MBL1095684.1 hypothetical protein [Streptomyces coffeae]
MRERIQQSRAVGGMYRLLRGFQMGQPLGELCALLAQGGVLSTDRVAELLLLLLVRPAVRESTDEPGLALPDGLDGLLQRGAFLRGAVAGLVREPGGFECGFEVGTPVGSEDVGGEEAGDGCDQDLFPNPQALGMVTEPGLVPVFIRVDLAGVVRDPVAVLAEHAAVADLADDVRPQDIGTPRGRVGVGPVGRP